jgi:hypothetical protein
LRNTLDQRHRARPLAPRLMPRERSEDRDRGGHHRDEPQRPAQLTALHQRVDQQHGGGAGQRNAGQVKTPRALGRGHRRKEPRAHEQHERADGDVDEEDRAPAGADDVGVDQQAGNDRAQHGGQAGDRTQDRPRLAHLVRREEVADQSEDLRQHDRAERTLQRTRADQHLGRRRRRAQHRGDREAAGADQQHPLAAEHVAEPPAGEQADGHRERVGRRDPLEVGVRAAEVGLHHRAGDAGDRRVQQVHHRRRQGGREGDPRRLGDGLGLHVLLSNGMAYSA